MPDSNDIFSKLNYKDKSDYEIVKDYLAEIHPDGQFYFVEPRFYVQRVEKKGVYNYIDFKDADSLMTAAGSEDKTLIYDPWRRASGETVELSKYAADLVVYIVTPYREKQSLKRFDAFVKKHYTKSFVPFTYATGGGSYGGINVSVTLSRPKRDKIPDDEFYTCNKCFSLVISKFVVDHVTYHTDAVKA